MEAIVPYLNFNGNGAEALAFYAKVFDGKTLFQQTFGDSPMADKTPADYKNKIMHATFQAGDLTFMISDCMPGQEVSTGTNMSLSLNFKTVADIDKIFAALSDGATVTMPLQDTFWGAKFGMLTDKFGINWMFNHDYEKKEK
ncbi:MAG TPA: VOC family protein [Chitinophagaceae bacterium]|nr:VOC family protein [Chitinophagaceae bacterium]